MSSSFFVCLRDFLTGNCLKGSSTLSTPTESRRASTATTADNVSLLTGASPPGRSSPSSVHRSIVSAGTNQLHQTRRSHSHASEPGNGATRQQDPTRSRSQLSRRGWTSAFNRQQQQQQMAAEYQASFYGSRRNQSVNSSNAYLAATAPYISEEQQVMLAQRIGLISHLPTGVYQEMGSKKNRECVICMIEFEEGDGLRYLPCLHTYHTQCIDDWLMRSLTCPSCLQSVDTGLLLSSSLVSQTHNQHHQSSLSESAAEQTAQGGDSSDTSTAQGSQSESVASSTQLVVNSSTTSS